MQLKCVILILMGWSLAVDGMAQDPSDSGYAPRLSYMHTAPGPRTSGMPRKPRRQPAKPTPESVTTLLEDNVPPKVRAVILGDPASYETSRTIADAPSPEIAALLQQEHFGRDFHYVFTGVPVSAPAIIELGFAETYCTQPGQRVFDVTINGKRALSSVDIFAQTGGMDRAYIRRFSITARKGLLDIHFSSQVDNAKISYVRVQGRAFDVILGPQNALALTTAERASWDPTTGEIRQDETHLTWPSGVPFGGIGTGKFEILPNGSFANFTINNNWDLNIPDAPGTFVAVSAKAVSNGGMARILRVREPYTVANDYYNARSMPACAYRGMYPFADLSFSDSLVPLKVRLNCMSPMIPQNEHDSALPGAVLVVDVENPNRYPVSGSAVLSWEDLNGRGGARGRKERFDTLNQLVHSEAGFSGVSGIHFTSEERVEGRRSTFVGDYFIGVETTGVVVTRTLHWDPLATKIPWWERFVRTGRLERPQKTPALWRSAGRTASSAAAVCASFNLAPGERRKIPFYITWYMPNLVMTHKDQVVTESADYTTTLASSVGVAAYMCSNRARFTSQTLEWHNLLTQSNLPGWLKVKMLNSAFPMAANTVFLKDGRFSMLESPEDMNGALGSMDQRMAAHAFLCTMFPKLDKAELNLFGKAQQPDGRITHFIGNLHESLGSPDVDYGITDWPDLSASWVFQVLKQYRWSNDSGFLAENYPRILRAMQFLESADTDHDGIPEGGSTYDYEAMPRGTFAYTASCYLGALRAAEAAANATTDTVHAKRFSAQFANSSASMMKQLWAGDHFMKLRNPATGEVTSSSFVASLAGDWLTRVSALPPTLPDEIAASATQAIITRHLDKFHPVPPMEVETDGSPHTSTCFILQNEPYLGCEAIYTGFADAGLDMLSRVYQASFSINKNPWDQSLAYKAPSGQKGGLRCYMTAPATWHALPALTGFSLDLPNETLYLDPHIPAAMNGELHVPLFSPAFWAWLDYSEAASTGTLRIVKTFPGDAATTTSQPENVIRRIAKRVGYDGKPVGEKVLEKPFVIRPREVLVF